MSESKRARVSELLAQIALLSDTNDLALVAKVAAKRLAFVHARILRAGVGEIGARVEIVDLNNELDGLTGTLLREVRKPRRTDTHFVFVELDGPSIETLAARSAKWRNKFDVDGPEVFVSRSNLSLVPD